MAKKLSKSDTRQIVKAEVFRFRWRGDYKWLWACEMGCYSAEEYDRASYLAAINTARRHLAQHNA